MSVSWKERVEAMVTEAAASWFTRATALAHAGRGPAFYLYYRPSTAKEFGDLDLVSEGETLGDGWTLADPEAYYPSGTQDQVRARVRTIAWTLPILPLELD